MIRYAAPLGLLLAVLTGPGSAAAHPFGPPLQAAVSAEGSTVTVVWSAQSDDLFDLGQATGALAQRQVFTYQDGVPAEAAEETASVDEQLAAAPEIRDYLSSHVGLRSEHADCPLLGVDIRDLTTSGARLSYDCGQPVEVLELEITALTDLHPDYRTVATGSGGDRTLHTATEPRQRLSLAAETGSSVGALLPGLGMLVVVSGALAAAIVRRRRSAASPPR